MTSEGKDWIVSDKAKNKEAAHLKLTKETGSAAIALAPPNNGLLLEMAPKLVVTVVVISWFDIEVENDVDVELVGNVDDLKKSL